MALRQPLLKFDRQQCEARVRILKSRVCRPVDEIVERMNAEKMTVCRVGMSLLMRIERDDDRHESGRFRNPMNLFHHLENIVEVFDDVVAEDLVEMIIGKWIWKTVEVVNHIGVRTRIDIDADRAGTFAKAAAEVENSKWGDGWTSWLFALSF